MYTLPDVWIRPNFGGKGRKVTGQLEAHSNGFRYSSPKGETLDIMFRWVFHSIAPTAFDVGSGQSAPSPRLHRNECQLHFESGSRQQTRSETELCLL